MVVWQLKDPLGNDPFASLPLAAISHDWWGERVLPPPRYALVADPAHLWLLAAHDQPARPHPGAGCGDFAEGLWQHDVVELFISGPRGYLEFNLSPAGAWWCARFSAPRVRHEGMPRPAATTRAATGSGWQAALGIPLADLRRETGLDQTTRINVTMILESPNPRFFSVADLGGGQPDFHRPDAYQAIGWRAV